MMLPTRGNASVRRRLYSAAPLEQVEEGESEARLSCHMFCTCFLCPLISCGLPCVYWTVFRAAYAGNAGQVQPYWTGAYTGLATSLWTLLLDAYWTDTATNTPCSYRTSSSTCSPSIECADDTLITWRGKICSRMRTSRSCRLPSRRSMSCPPCCICRQHRCQSI